MSVSLFFIGISLGLIAFLLLVLSEKKVSQTFYIKPFIWLVFIATLYELLVYYFRWITAYWYRTYTLFEFLFLFYFYFYTLKKQYKIFFVFSFIFFILLYIYLLIIWDINESSKTESFLTITETIFVLVSSILWFKTIFGDLKENSLLKAPDYYFISGFVLYFTGTFFLFLVSDFMLKNMTSQFLSYWNLNILFTILLRTLLITGIWMARKK